MTTYYTIGQVHLLTKAPHPTLTLIESSGRRHKVPFIRVGKGRRPGEMRWLAEPAIPAEATWTFQLQPSDNRVFSTQLHRLWLQDNEVFAYEPSGFVSASQVIKIPDFGGSLPPRALYVYLPRGYNEHIDKRYPVLYMHDGQNCFETYNADSYAGTWRTEGAADAVIGSGQMRECIIVAVSNGRNERMAEYLPPYASYRMPSRPAPRRGRKRIKRRAVPSPLIIGQADRTLVYYRDEVAPYINDRFRTLTDRDNTATCGSSMGGLFSTYIAWEHPQFARHHAFISPAYHTTRRPDGAMEIVERIRNDTRPDVRIWLDSGTRDTEDSGDDDMVETQQARDALLAAGFEFGTDFRYYLDQGAIHHESAWSKRLPQVFEFLFPLEELTA